MRKSQQAPHYQVIPGLLRTMREDAQLTQRDLGQRVGRPQSWVYNCETCNRRVDIAEFTIWARACNQNPQEAYAQLLGMLRLGGIAPAGKLPAARANVKPKK